MTDYLFLYTMLKASDITKNYSELKVLKGVDIEVGKGEIVSIVGSSGAGKSTLLHILGTLDKPDSGEVVINDERVFRFQGARLAAFRNHHIGFVFQFHHLLPEFTALENVCIPGWISGGKSKKEVREYAFSLLEQMGLTNRIDHKPGKLSGGEQQRVAVARALINQPDIILADEPTGNLDSVNARELHELFFTLRERFRQTFVIATHNEQLARMTDRQLQMKDGKITNY